ncbi:MAG: hypothetical protein HY270_14260 [Deltaproteobacteria bacterium]|nr:hypothetical protein [Deltaproteobacteria bacterium]
MSKPLVQLFPGVTLALCMLLLMWQPTQVATLWMLHENNPVEMLTFVFLMMGALQSAKLARDLRRQREPLTVWGFYVLFALGMFFTAGEEVAWGQLLFGFTPPAFIADINVQHELSIHNLRGLAGRSEFLRLAFGLGGLIGTALSRQEMFRKLAPPRALLAWLLPITLHAAVDCYGNVFPINAYLDALLTPSSEYVEMLIGLTGFLYARENAWRLAHDG